VQQNSDAIPDDLVAVIEAWDRLSEAVRADILAMVETGRQNK
jgi:hypothetical protein